MGSEPPKIGVGTQTGVRVCGLPVRPLTRTGQTDPGPLGVNSTEGGIYSVLSDLPSQEVHVSDRPSYSNRKTGAPRQTSYEAYSVAPQKTLEGPRITGKGDSSSKDSPPAPTMVDQGDKCLARSTSAPSKDASKEGWGAHLGDFTASSTCSVPESQLHINFLELKAVLLALKRFQHIVQGKVVLVATDNTTVVAYINKEGG